MTEARNSIAVILSVLAGVLLIVSGTRGPIAIYESVLENLSAFVPDPALSSFLRIVVLILIGLSSLGGFAVIIGGYLIYKRHIGTGKIMISLGAGVGMFWLIFIVFSFAATQELSSIIAQHSLPGWVGVLLAFTARMLATAEKRH